MPSMIVSRTGARFVPDPRRVLAKPFIPGGPDGRARAERILSPILTLPEPVVASTLRAAEARYGARHRNLSAAFDANFATIAHMIDGLGELSVDRRTLIGAYFTHEYSIEAAALSNPSIVAAPDQSGLAAGEQRFVLSLRSIGEGHISSIQFRSGVIDETGRIAVDVPSPYVTTARHRPPIYDKLVFRSKLTELHASNEAATRVLDALPERFTMDQLEAVIREVDREPKAWPGAKEWMK